MTDQYFDADGNPVEIPESPNVRQMRERIEQLEAEANRAKDLEAQLQGVQRTHALSSAGLQLDEVKQKALEAVHQGEWTPDALKDTAVKLGWMEATPPVPPQEQQSLGRMEAAIQGGNHVPPNADVELDQRLAQARTEQEFIEIYRQSGRPLN